MYNHQDKRFLFKDSKGRIGVLWAGSRSGLFFCSLGRRDTWSEPVSLCDDLYGPVSATLDDRDEVHVLFQSQTGALQVLHLGTLPEPGSLPRQLAANTRIPVLNSRSGVPGERFPYLVPLGDTLHLFYTVPHNNRLLLTHQTIREGKVSSPAGVDHLPTQSGAAQNRPYTVISGMDAWDRPLLLVLYPYQEQSERSGGHRVGLREYDGAKGIFRAFEPLWEGDFGATPGGGSTGGAAAGGASGGAGGAASGGPVVGGVAGTVKGAGGAAGGAGGAMAEAVGGVAGGIGSAASGGIGSAGEGTCPFAVCSPLHGSLHAVFNRRGEGLAELVYTRRSDLNLPWASPTVLATSRWDFENTSILILQDALIVFWVRDGNISYCISKDDGITFRKPARLDFPGDRSLSCSSYFTNLPGEAGRISLSELPSVYSDRLKTAFYESCLVRSITGEGEAPTDLGKIIVETLNSLKNNMDNIHADSLEIRSWRDEIEHAVEKLAIRVAMLEKKGSGETAMRKPRVAVKPAADGLEAGGVGLNADVKKTQGLDADEQSPERLSTEEAEA